MTVATPASDRHGEYDTCLRCGYVAPISRSSAHGGFLKLHKDGSLLCWNGRECGLRLRRKRRRS